MTREDETFVRNSHEGQNEMSAAVASALKSSNLWLTVAYIAALLLLAKAYA
ncbi:MAG: hypothetical protein FJ091_14460 [Deltaproteobacteria bacterium]|nr:hypothetical protein [Deltaproteobacteria bacterium]